ncbi:MAG TPA: sensor histidine kinase, partial [Actinopolymorphaceae bacterium]
PGMTFRGPDALGILLQVGSTLPLTVRRRHPIAVAAVVSASYMTLGLLGYSSIAGGLAVLFAVYTLGAYAPLLPGLLVCVADAALSVVYLAVNADILADFSAQLNALTLVTSIGQFFAVWIVGRAIGARRVYLDELRDHAEQLERTRAAEVRAALAEERTRVARELHDVVAHHVSVMTVQAAAARRTLERAPEVSREAMQTVEDTGRTALSEMRRIVGALRNADPAASDEPDGGALAPRVGVAHLGELLERSRYAGLQARLTVVGSPRPLPSSVDLAVYRVVQESLTNTLRHAGQVPAEVRLQYLDDRIRVTVTDKGDSRPSLSLEKPVGHGLIGMRERVALNGGSLRAGPRLRGGFQVDATIPLSRPADSSAEATAESVPASTPASTPESTSETGSPSRPTDEPEGSPDDTSPDDTASSRRHDLDGGSAR